MSGVLAPPCPPEDWPLDHVETPICYERYKVHLDGPEACYVVILGGMLWGATWPELRAKIDAALGYRGSSDANPRTLDQVEQIKQGRN